MVSLLQDILENEIIKLDNNFKNSLMMDLAQVTRNELFKEYNKKNTSDK